METMKPVWVLWFFTLVLLQIGRSAASKGFQSVGTSLGLQCPPCERIHCNPRRPGQLKCKAGIVTGICSCCPVCAKTTGERCGGQWNYLGKCDQGLYCEPDEKNKISANEYLDSLSASNEIWMAEGTCRRGHELNDGPQTAPKCLPRCTPDFCRDNVKEICSAVDNADRKQQCQGDCQHTSCSACRFIKPDSHECAIRCRKDDIDCLKKFGRCVKKLYCSRTEYPCKANTMEYGMKFRCIVPDCQVGLP